MYKKGAGNDKQGKDAGNRTLCPYRNFSQAIRIRTNTVLKFHIDLSSPKGIRESRPSGNSVEEINQLGGSTFLKIWQK